MRRITRRKIDAKKFSNIFKALQDGKEPKRIAFDNGVSYSRIYDIQKNHPLFFGLRHPYKRKD